MQQHMRAYKKRKRQQGPDPDSSPDSELPASIAARLTEHGEAFLAAFDDRDAAVAVPTISEMEPVASEPSSSSNSEELDAEPGAVSPSLQQTGLRSRAPALLGPNLEARAKIKAERRRFMSGKANRVHGATPAEQPDRKRQKPSKGLHRAASLEELGMLQAAQVRKRPRMSAKIGYGVAKKQAERSQEAFDQAVAAGMASVKGQGKKRRAETRAARDKGLSEQGSAFQGGMLRLPGLQQPGSQTRGKDRRPARRAFKSSSISVAGAPPKYLQKR